VVCVNKGRLSGTVVVITMYELGADKSVVSKRARETMSRKKEQEKLESVRQERFL
jgi:hypothetical protein